MKVNQRPSGLYVVEEGKREPPKPAKVITCAKCGKTTPGDPEMTAYYGRPKGWFPHDISCPHGLYWTCDECGLSMFGCEACGITEEKN